MVNCLLQFTGCFTHIYRCLKLWLKITAWCVFGVVMCVFLLANPFILALPRSEPPSSTDGYQFTSLERPSAARSGVSPTSGLGKPLATEHAVLCQEDSATRGRALAPSLQAEGSAFGFSWWYWFSSVTGWLGNVVFLIDLRKFTLCCNSLSSQIQTKFNSLV